MLNEAILSILYVLVSLFCAVAYGRLFQVLFHYRVRSLSSTFLVGLPIFWLVNFLLLLPSLFIIINPEIYWYYFASVLGIVGISSLIIFITLIKTFRKNWIETLIYLATAIAVSGMLIATNNSPNIEFKEMLVDRSFTVSFFDINNPNESKFFMSGIIKFLSGWLLLFDTNSLQGVSSFVNYGVPVVIAFFLSSVMFGIGRDVLNWKKIPSLVLAPLLSLTIATLIVIVKINVALGFTMPLLILASMLNLFFFQMNNNVKGRGIQILTGGLFTLSFLFDYQSWAIGAILLVCLTFYQGYRLKAISLQNTVAWLSSVILNILFVYSAEIEAVIIIFACYAVFILLLILYLSGRKYYRSYLVEKRFWRHRFLISSTIFIGLIIGAAISVAENTELSYNLWTSEGFWALEIFSGELASKLILGLVGILLSAILFYYIVCKVAGKSNQFNTFLFIILGYITFFFNPLVTPLYLLVAMPQLYLYGLVFLISLVILSFFNWFKDIEKLSDPKCYSLIIFITAWLIGGLSYIGYEEVNTNGLNTIESTNNILKTRNFLENGIKHW